MKKLMIAAAAVAMVGGASAAPIVYDYKASVKHTYLKAKNNVKEIFGVQLPSTQVYIKYTKSSSLQGYLIQDVDGVLGKHNGYVTYEDPVIDPATGAQKVDATTGLKVWTKHWHDVREITKNDAQPGNRCFLVVMNKSAEKYYRVPRIIPGIIDAKWYDDKLNGQTTVPAQGYLYLGGEVVARSNALWETPIKIGVDAVTGADQFMTIRDFEGFNGTKFAAADDIPGWTGGSFRHFYNNQRLETVKRYPNQIENIAPDADGSWTTKNAAKTQWDNNYRDLWYVNEDVTIARNAQVGDNDYTRTAEFGIDDYWFTSCYLFGQYNQPAWNGDTVEEFADCWMNGAGFGKATHGTVSACCGRAAGSNNFVLKQLSGNLKAGIYLCSETGDDVFHNAIFARTGRLEDQLWLGVRTNAGTTYATPIYWGLDGAWALNKQDIWADGNLDLATTDVGSGTWSIKLTTALDGKVDSKLSEAIPDAWNLKDGTSSQLVRTIDAAMATLDKSCKSGITLFGSPLKDVSIDFGLIDYSFFKNYLAEDRANPIEEVYHN